VTDSERADLIGFTLTHSLLRNELPRLAAAMAGRPTSATEEHVVEDHVRLVMDHLVRHHQEEDDFHWPLLVSRAPRAARLLALLEAEHSEMDQLVDGVRDRDLPRRTRAAAMSHLSELVLAHLEEEDRSVVPLLAMHVTAAEQRESMARSRGKIPKTDELRVLAMMLAVADDGERARMLAPLPEAVANAWAHEGSPQLTQVHRVLADVAGRPAEGDPQ